jgi:hypothetical protein
MATTTQILRGLEIIEKYEPGTDVSADHDQIWAGSQNLLFQMTEEEAETMCAMGWLIDEEMGCWTILT